MQVKKAIIPCAGFGTRFLPVTKVLPKELLPIIDVPALSHIVKEAADSGIEEVLIIISPQKHYIKKLFEENRVLNEFLQSNGKTEEYKIANLDYGVKVKFAVQRKMNGNGMAVYIGKEFVGDEAFAILFGDDVMYTGDGTPVTKQLIDAYQTTGGHNIIGCQQMSEDVARRCGVMIDGKRLAPNITEVKGIVEKPKGELPGRLASLGRFVVNAEIFDAIKCCKKGKDGEVYLTDAFNVLAANGKNVSACEFEARRYDIGNKEGYLEATVEYALRDEKLKDEFLRYLKTLNI